mmetsp:Transcript_24189/g.29329  ORF Transcript_24189/g.29329 Transcript_24189/m.29329 type:complete len:564 (+) Transcript_24189:2602-4293(+)
MKGVRVRAELFVLLDWHLVLDVHVRRVELRLLVLENRVDEVLFLLGEFTDIVSLPLHHCEHLPDGAKDIEVCSCSDISLVRREGEHCDGQLLLSVLLPAEVSPLDGTFSHRLYLVVQRVRLSSSSVAAREDDGIHTTIQLRERHLECHLDWVKTKGGVLPLLSCLEHKRHGHHVGHIQLLQGLNSLRVVLAGGASNQSKASEGDNGVDEGQLGEGVVEVLLNRAGEVQTTGEDGDNLSTLGLKRHDNGRVVAFVSSDQVSSLEDETDDRAVLLEHHVLPGVIPVEVFLQILIHSGSHRMPHADVREHDRLCDRHLCFLKVWDVGGGDQQQEVLKVLWGSSEPILKTLNEVTGVLCLVVGQVLKNLGKSAEQLQKTVLEAAATLSLLLLHEVGDHGLGLTQLGHREASKLVETHNSGHGRETQDGIHALALGLNHSNHLLGELLDKDKRGNKNVGGSDVLLELLVVIWVAELLQQVSDHLEANIFVVLVNLVYRCCERRLVLGFQHDVDDLNRQASICVAWLDTTGVRSCVGKETTLASTQILDIIVLTLSTTRTFRGVRDGLN